MNKEIKGYCVQKGKPNPNKPVDIETNIIGKNLFETYEVNGRQYTDNLGHNAFISIPKEQYIEYEQLQQENKQLKEDFAVLKKLQMISNDILNELEGWLKEHKNLYEGNEFQNNAKFCMTVDQVLDKIQKLKEKYK